MQNTVAVETVAFEPIAFSPNTVPVVPSPNTGTAAPWLRTLARKWDMIAVIALMLASSTYGIYALLFLTGY